MGIEIWRLWRIIGGTEGDFGSIDCLCSQCRAQNGVGVGLVMCHHPYFEASGLSGAEFAKEALR